MLCFGLVWHPDPARIGALAPIRFDQSGAAVLSRLTPEFHDCDLPLLDRHISRAEITLTNNRDGSITFSRADTRMPFVVNGFEIGERGTFGMEELGSEIIVMLGNAVILSIFNAPIKSFHKPLHGTSGLIGISETIALTRASITRVGGTMMPVLILGETGTGKELVAQALHGASARRNMKLVTANMAAIPPTLAAAELFGTKRGAFTGATSDRSGLFKLADRSTLFLDEIGDAPADIQAMLLRTLETREVFPIGATSAVRVDARIISATDKNIDELEGATQFNQPLFQRLNGTSIRLAPLRHRRIDIGLLIKAALEDDRDALPVLPPEAIAATTVHSMVLDPWPGNVRQLFNAVRRLRLGEPFVPQRQSPHARAHAGDGARTAPPIRTPRATTFRYRTPQEIDDAALLEALDNCGWVIKETAEALNVSRTSLYQLMSECDAIRSGNDLTDDEIEDVMKRLDGGVTAWAKHLRVGREALRKRIALLKARY